MFVLQKHKSVFSMPIKPLESPETFMLVPLLEVASWGRLSSPPDTRAKLLSEGRCALGTLKPAVRIRPGLSPGYSSTHRV